MRVIMTAALVTLLAATNYAFAQVVDPDIRGPARRAAGAAGEALGAPGVEDRIERRQMRRDDRRGDWRMSYYNNEWWYYTPENRWMFYRDNRWTPYDRAAFQPLRPRYSTGYRGTDTRTGRVDRGAYGKAGPPDLTIGIDDGSFTPSVNPLDVVKRWYHGVPVEVFSAVGAKRGATGCCACAAPAAAKTAPANTNAAGLNT
jgi:hypothetical protein